MPRNQCVVHFFVRDFVPKLAFPDHGFLPGFVQANDVDVRFLALLGIRSPPGADPGHGAGKCSENTSFQGVLPAHLFKHAAHERGKLRFHVMLVIEPAFSDFDGVHRFRDKAIPEAQHLVRQDIAGLLFVMLLRDRLLALHNTRFCQIFQGMGYILRGDARFVGNFLHLIGPGGNRFNDAAVTVHIPEFLGQQVIGFLIEITGFGEKQGNDIVIQRFLFVKQCDIFGDTSCQTVSNCLVISRPGRKEQGRLTVIEGIQLQLHRTAAKERAFFAEHLVFHKTDGRAADDQKHFAKLPLLVYVLLQGGSDALFLPGQIGQFVNDHDHPFIPALIAQERAQIVEGTEGGHAHVRRQRFQRALTKQFHVALRRRFDRRKEHGLFILAKLPEQRCFSYTPTAINHGHLEVVFSICCF